MAETELDIVGSAYAAEDTLAQTLDRRDMRRAGLTVLNVRRRVKQMARSGELTRDMSRDRIREIVMDDLMGDNPRAFENFGAVDWDAILAFIEKLLPLILQLIALFG
jgi:hypothetical protein